MGTIKLILIAATLTYMKTVFLLLPLALAIDQPKDQCANFLTIKTPQKVSRGRYRRAQQAGWFDFTTSSGSTQTQAPATSHAQTTVTEVTDAQTSAATVQVTDAPTSSPTTETTNVNTAAPTTATEPALKTTTQSATSVTGTYADDDEDDKAIIVMLDATGSMQNIGGKGRGRNLVINKMEQFRNMLNKKVQKDKVTNQPLTFVTFNEKATWKSYDSIAEWPTLSRSNYNPGWQTNLYDSMGCVLSEYKSRHPDQEVSVYLISDGVHQMTRNKQHLVAYEESEVNNIVEELRTEGWNFHFYGATDVNKKNALKKQAIDLGFRAAETRVFDFNGKEFGALLKSILQNMVKGEKENVKQEICEKCPKGRMGRMCRKRVANKINLGQCVKA